MHTILVICFVIGYILIALEHVTGVSKSAVALITAGVCWTLYMFSPSPSDEINAQLLEHLADAAGILFFLLGAMTIVEIIDAHNGFDIISRVITTNSKRSLTWIICLLAFLLSAILDNLTTTIVMLSVTRKLIGDKNDRLMLAGMIVIAANAGGVCSPIGDVTTTMLWIGGQVTAKNILLKLALPSLACLLVPLILVSISLKGNFRKPAILNSSNAIEVKEGPFILALGLLALLGIPLFKSLTHLPPFMGMLLSLGIMWVITELIHRKKEEKESLSVSAALQKIDTPSILFFLGILLSIGVLDSTGILGSTAQWLSSKIGSIPLLTTVIGILSAIVDNVPLVAASQSMFSMEIYPTDHPIWEMLAYATGTGGSILIIGSAAGVVAMGIESINFLWYVKRYSLLALLGFLSGMGVYLLQDWLFF